MDEEAAGVVALFKQEDQGLLTSNELLKLREQATRGISPKIQFVPIAESDEQLINSYANLTMQLTMLQKKARVEDMMDGFTVVVPDLAQAGAVKPETYNVFQDYMKLTGDMVRGSTKFLRLYGQEYDLQNLNWGQELVENSCEDDLNQKAMERLLNILELE